MKTFTHTHGILTILIFVISGFISMPNQAQTIQINSTFNSDGEIFPFGTNDTIYGLSISGSVTLSSDTSLVRVILTDNSDNEWMVYEAFPMIVSGIAFDIENICDETCYLDERIPHSLKIYIRNAIFDFDQISFEAEKNEDVDSMAIITKMSLEVSKIEAINQYILNHNWNWVAGLNSLDYLFYSSKKNRFGTNYNLLGYEYYTSGIYKNIESTEIYFDNSSLVKSFDWRKKHDANLAGSKYYDQDPDYPQVGNGWMTKVKNQTGCGACTAFGSVAALEALTNLYFNYHVDGVENLLLSERDAFNCSKYGAIPGNDVGCECSLTWGKPLSYVIEYITNTGIVNEACFPWIVNQNNCYGKIADCSPLYTNKCEEPDVIIKPDGFFKKNHSLEPNLIDSLKTHLLNNGPLICEFDLGEYNHVIALVGFGEDPNDGLYWILKDSYGTLAPPHDGYKYYNNSFFNEKIRDSYYYFDTSLTINPQNYLSKQCLDKDKDGYWNWGIGGSPQNFSCSDDEDWNDNHNRIGPRDENYNGTPVKPEMNVSTGTFNPTPINNKSFYFFNGNPTTIKFDIKNTGNAQLNLDSESDPVTLIEVGTSFFSIIGQPESQICMENESSFSIHFETSLPNNTWYARIIIQLDPCDGDIYDYFEFELVYNGCNLIGQDHHVRGYEPYNGYNLIPNDIYIDNGGIMEVFGSLAMYPESDIFVDAGGKLIVNGGLITGITGNNENCRNLWHGIDIWGNPGQPQWLNYQGRVSVINGGCIEYAEIGIETAHHLSPRTWYPSGGIISCSDAVFKDNITDIKFYPYNNTHPVTHQIIPNISRFTRTLFETTDDLFKFNFGLPSTHIFMSQVGGISLNGCSLVNYSTYHPGSRGKGIESYGAGYFVSTACAQDGITPCPTTVPCRFENLDYGIRSFNNYGLYTINVGTAEFIHNRRGIYLGAVNNATIIRNTFDISDPEHLQPNDTLVGLYLDAYTTGFVVEENTFTGPSTISKTVGIHLMNTGTNQNEIYNNTFATLKQGVMAVGTNRLSPHDLDPGSGLCVKCNDFTACNNDVWVTPVIINGIPYPTQNTGIAKQQGEMGNGDKTKAAGNKFSDVTSYNYFNYSGCGHIDYTYHGFGTPPNYLIPNFYGDFRTIPDPNAQYFKSESCPSHLGGSIILSMEKNTLINEANLIDSYRDTLLITTDGGNTEGLNYEVITSFPEEALVIKQELMEKSPYLSDTVMISAIGKEEVLPGAMVRDILISNPQAPKSKKIMNALDQRQDTIPDYMLEEIKQGLNTFGAKELLEQKLGSHQARKAKALTNINLFYKNDTANWNYGIDSLIDLYEDQNKLSDKYVLAFLFLDKSDSSSAFSVLNSISGEFDMDEQELLVHDQYQELFEMIWEIKSDSIGLDSLQIQTLLEMSSVSNSMPAIFASNLLINEGFMIYDEPVYFGEEIVKNVDAPAKITAIHDERSSLKLFPNPAGNYFIAQYDLQYEEFSGVITISDINGKELRALQLKDKQNQIVIPALELINGMYIIKLLAGNKILDADKISINR